MLTKKYLQTQHHPHLQVSLNCPAPFYSVNRRGPLSWFPCVVCSTWLWDHPLLDSALLACPASFSSQRSQTNLGVFIVLSHSYTPTPTLSFPLLYPPPIFHPQAIVGYFDIFFDNGCSNKVRGGGGTSYLTETQLCSRLVCSHHSSPVFLPPSPGERRWATVLADCWCQHYSSKVGQSEPADARHASWLQPLVHTYIPSHTRPPSQPPTLPPTSTPLSPPPHCTLQNFFPFSY